MVHFAVPPLFVMSWCCAVFLPAQGALFGTLFCLYAYFAIVWEEVGR